MIDIALDTNTHDIIFTQNRTFKDCVGIERIAQQVKITLWTFLGEWFLDSRVGVPYEQAFFIKNPPMRAIKTILTEAIKSVDGVQSVLKLELTISAKRRTLSVNSTILTNEGLMKIDEQRTL